MSGPSASKMSGTLARVLTAAVLIPIVVAVVLWGPAWLVAIAVGLVTVLALLEFLALGEKIGMHGFRIWTSFCGVGLVYCAWIQTEQQLSGSAARSGQLSTPFNFLNGFDFRNPEDITVGGVFLLFAFGTAAIVIFGRRPLKDALHGVGIGSAALLLIGLPLSFLVHLLEGGERLLLFLLVLVWVGDTAAYFVGRKLGKHLLAPQLSPKKTWEGVAANLAGSLVVAYLFARWLSIPWELMIIAGLLGSVVGQISDLLESAFKRSAGVKDSGSLLPGHGGVLDRIDALILAAPVVWYYFARWMPIR